MRLDVERYVLRAFRVRPAAVAPAPDPAPVRPTPARPISEAASAPLRAAAAAAPAAPRRGVAGGIDGILSGIVATLGTDLRIEKGRLVCATVRGESTLFAELSQGERWKRVIETRNIKAD